MAALAKHRTCVFCLRKQQRSAHANGDNAMVAVTSGIRTIVERKPISPQRRTKGKWQMANECGKLIIFSEAQSHTSDERRETDGGLFLTNERHLTTGEQREERRKVIRKRRRCGIREHVRSKGHKFFNFWQMPIALRISISSMIVQSSTTISALHLDANCFHSVSFRHSLYSDDISHTEQCIPAELCVRWPISLSLYETAHNTV